MDYTLMDYTFMDYTLMDYTFMDHTLMDYIQRLQIATFAGAQSPKAPDLYTKAPSCHMRNGERNARFPARHGL